MSEVTEEELNGGRPIPGDAILYGNREADKWFEKYIHMLKERDAALAKLKIASEALKDIGNGKTEPSVFMLRRDARQALDAIEKEGNA